ncbi:MAG: PspA/IM30 family protein [Spirochaetia bacterium]
MSDNYSSANFDPHSAENLDITGLDPASAGEFVMAYVTTLKQTKADLQKKEEEFNLWKNRAKLALEKNREDLASQAANRASELEGQVKQLESEKQKLELDIESLQSQLRMIKKGPDPTTTTKAEMLLQQLESMGGTVDETKEAFKEQEADDMLEKFKEQMNAENENS